MPFLTLYQLYRCGQCTSPGFIRTSHTILSNPQATFPNNRRRTVDSYEREMKPVPIAIIIYPREKIDREPGIERATSSCQVCTLPSAVHRLDSRCQQ